MLDCYKLRFRFFFVLRKKQKKNLQQGSKWMPRQFKQGRCKSETIRVRTVYGVITKM